MPTQSPQPKCTITPPTTPHHTHTIIFLHGRGDTATSFSTSLTHSTSSVNLTLPQHFPSARWVFPTSELRPTARAPPSFLVSQWFDTWDVANLSYREELQMPGLGESVDGIRGVVERETEMLGGRWERVVLAGISQGGAVVMHTLLNLNVHGDVGGQGEGWQTAGPRLGGVMGFSCRFPFPGRSLEETRAIVGLEGVPGPGDDGLVRRTPVLIEHCLDDPLVKVDTGREVRDTMRRFGAEVTWREYASGGHWLQSPEGIDDAVAWLKEHVFGDEAGVDGGAAEKGKEGCLVI